MEDYLTVKDLMNLLQVSEPTVHRWMRLEKNPLPYIKIAQSIRFIRKDIDIWIKNFRKGGETKN